MQHYVMYLMFKLMFMYNLVIAFTCLSTEVCVYMV